MRAPDPSFDHVGTRTRVLALLRAAAGASPHRPAIAGAWLHAPHPGLLGATPAAAAWYSARLAAYAMSILAAGSDRAAASQGVGPWITKLPSKDFR